MLNILWQNLFLEPLANGLVLFSRLFSGNLGAAIFGLTFLVRLALLPFAIRGHRAQEKMRALQPELARLREVHKGDPQAFARAQLELFRIHGAHPLSGCLPQLAQIPILIALYMVFFRLTGDTAFRELLYPAVAIPPNFTTHFLWVDLAQRDPFFVLPILAGLLQFVATMQLIPLAKLRSGEPHERLMTWQFLILFPVMTVVIAVPLPSALSLYWVATTVFSIVQQWVMTKITARSSVAITITKKER